MTTLNKVINTKVSLYEQIIGLKSEADRIKKGNLFESIFREILPWDNRPPIVSHPKSEQLDGVFLYKGQLFLVECKAKERKITAGSDDWTKYEHKLYKRHGYRGGVFGIFASLYDVGQNTIERGNQLINNGYPNIILSGGIWDKLHESKISFQSLLDYYTQLVRIDYKCSEPDFDKIISWAYDQKSINSYFKSLSKTTSAIFLRRNKHEKHDSIYVRRRIDDKIENSLALLRPTKLLQYARSGHNVKQLFVLNDISGSGKTTHVINQVIRSGNTIPIACAAKQTKVDEFLNDFLQGIEYDRFGIQQLRAINKCILFIIDSLDEVNSINFRDKKEELKSMFKQLDELNVLALANGYACFPIAVFITIRESYWRDWEALIDGRHDAQILTKTISTFHPDEFELALQKYSNAYDYSITNKLSSASKKTLSTPVNLEIFSEAYEYQHEITISNIWEAKILDNYFESKKEGVYKHQVSGFSESTFIRLLSQLGFQTIVSKSNSFTKREFKRVIKDHFFSISEHSDAVLRLLLSEQIITYTSSDKKDYQFRYIRFIEYLVARHILESVLDCDDFSVINDYIKIIHESGVVSIFQVQKNLRHLCATQFSSIGSKVNHYYSKSNEYMSKFLPRVRGLISRGYSISNNDINVLLPSNYTQSPSITWDSFFILAAKNSGQSASVILQAFKSAWDANKKAGNENAWKLIDKLYKRQLLLHEDVLLSLLENGSAKDWEVYLGHVMNQKGEFLNLKSQLIDDGFFDEKFEKNPPTWSQVCALIELINDEGSGALPDARKDEVKRSEYVLFGEDEQYGNLDSTKKETIDEFNGHFISSFESLNALKPSWNFQLSNITEIEVSYLNNGLTPLLKKTFGTMNAPFFIHLLENSEYYGFLDSVKNFGYVRLDVNSQDSYRKTVIQALIQSPINDKADWLHYIFSLGYKKNQSDDSFFNIQKSNHQIIDKTAFYLSYAYYQVLDPIQTKRIHEIEKVVYTLLTMYTGEIIGFGFSRIIQVANNALDYYSQFSKIILESIEHYGHLDELVKKKSFQGKMELALNKSYDSSYDDLFRKIFPGLV